MKNTVLATILLLVLFLPVFADGDQTGGKCEINQTCFVNETSTLEKMWDVLKAMLE